MKTWKTPENLRLRRIEQWRKERLDRLRNQVRTNDDIPKVVRAAELYTQAVARGDAIARGSVTGYDPD